MIVLRDEVGFSGNIRSNLISFLPKQDPFLGHNLEELGARLRGLVERYFEEYEQRSSLILNLHQFASSGQLDVILHDRPITAYQFIEIRRDGVESLSQELTSLLLTI